MYITAQRVRASDGTIGVNSFFYRHAGEELRDINWEAPLVYLIQT